MNNIKTQSRKAFGFCLKLVAKVFLHLYATKGYPIVIRKNTTDLDVFANIFVLGEFKVTPTLKLQPKFIVDVGAYTGISTVWFAQKYPNAQIIAIEPEESNFSFLKINTERLQNIKIFKAGIWYREAFLKIIDRGTGKWGFMVQEVPAGKQYDTKGMTIEEILRIANRDKIDLLKIDIEGAEKYLFENNSCKWLPKVNALFIELHDRINPGCTDAVFSAFNLDEWYVSKSQEKVVFVRKYL